MGCLGAAGTPRPEPRMSGAASAGLRTGMQWGAAAGLLHGSAQVPVPKVL